MRIASFNVNGIRAALKRGFSDWMETRDCDVIGLQEVRCRPADLPEGAFGDRHVSWAPGSLAGRNGVALLTRTAPAEVRSWGTHLVMTPGETPNLDEIRTGITDRLPAELLPFADEGRYIEVDLADAPVTVAGLYLPKGATPDPKDEKSIAKQDRKMTFLAGFREYLATRRQECAAQGRHVLLMGDFNIAHENADLKNWKSNQRNEGFLPEERQWFDTILSPETSTVPTPGGAGAARPSLMTPDGVSTITWPHRSWRGRPSRPRSTATPLTPSAPPTTRLSSSTTTCDSGRVEHLLNTTHGDAGQTLV